MSWVCLMFIGLQLDRGNLSNALADNFLKDLGVNQNVYNNGTTLQLLAFMRTLTTCFTVSLTISL